MQSGERYNSIGKYLKEYFGERTIKLSIDAGFTCPNRDGKIAYGGCLFCSSGGSGELASKYNEGDIAKTIDMEIAKYKEKWPKSKYLAYFQAHTNTYAPVEELRTKYYEALNDPRISGIVIATRPDCLPDDVLDLLEEINNKHFMWVELGLQTIHKDTSQAMNIGYDISIYDEAVEKLLSRNIKVVTHLILGLPNENEEMMLESVRYVCTKPIFGIKLHLFNLIKTSGIYKQMPDYVPFDSIEEYINLVIKCLENIPPEITIHRLTGDVPRKLLVSPSWSYKKRTILNGINYELKIRNTTQGAKISQH